MKYFILPIVAVVFLAACSAVSSEKTNNADPNMESFSYFGDSMSTEDAVEIKYLVERMAGNDSMSIKLTGNIKEVCQNKGCWMTLELENGQKVRVTFKDYGFFVPKDATGKSVIIDGMAYQQITSVDELQHYAEDAGKSAEEVAAITEGKQELTFTATGVAILN